MNYIKIVMMLILAVSLVGVCSAAETENVSVVSANETVKDIPKEIAFIQSVPEEKFHTNYQGRKTIVKESTHYFLGMKAFDAYKRYSGSNGDLHEDVLVVAYRNGTVKIFNLTTESEIIPKNGLKWRFTNGNSRCKTSHYTTMPPSGGGSEVEVVDLSGVPDEIQSVTYDDVFGMPEVSVIKGNVHKVCERGNWTANTVRDLRKQYPGYRVVIMEWDPGVPDQVQSTKNHVEKILVRGDVVRVWYKAGTWDENTILDLRKQYPGKMIHLWQWTDDN